MSLWQMLGEAKAKCENIAEVPLKPVIAHQLNQIYLAKGIQATTAIEGNSLTQEEVLEQIEGRLNLPPSKQYLAKEIDNILYACNSIVKECSEELTVESIKKFNSWVLKDLAVSEDVVIGEIRKINVVVGSYRAPDSQCCELLMQKFCDWYKNLEVQYKNDEEKSISIGIVRAILAHLYFVWIHPFGDGNGRTARLIELKTLLCAGVPVPAAHLLSNHYNQTREEYYRQLDLASRRREVISFLNYSVRGFVDQLNDQIKVIRTQQLRIAWQDFVYEMFSNKNSSADIRRRKLLLDLSSVNDAVPKNLIPNISVDIAREYANKTSKTLGRDLNVLKDMGLVREEKEGYVASKERILAFLPVTQKPPSLVL
jgi:Fic family protein